MVFSSTIFLLLFLPAVYLINAVIAKFSKGKTLYSNCFLLLASLVFYAWGEPVLVLLMIGSILLNWFCGMMIAKRARKALHRCTRGSGGFGVLQVCRIPDSDDQRNPRTGSLGAG